MAGQHTGEGTIETGDHGFNEFATANTAAIRLRLASDTNDRSVLNPHASQLLGTGSAAPVPAVGVGGPNQLNGTNVKAANMALGQVNNAAIVGAATGVVDVTLIWLPSGFVVTNLFIFGGTTALATPTHGW